MVFAVDRYGKILHRPFILGKTYTEIIAAVMQLGKNDIPGSCGRINLISDFYKKRLTVSACR